MKDHQLKLIDSTYNASDAREVVQSLLTDKIRFLNQKIFSLQERFGSNTDHQEKRVRELREELAQLRTLLEPYDDNEFEVEVKCVVNLKIRKTETVEV